MTIAGCEGTSSARLLYRALTATSGLVEKLALLDSELARSPAFQVGFSPAILSLLGHVQVPTLCSNTRLPGTGCGSWGGSAEQRAGNCTHQEHAQRQPLWTSHR